MKARLQDLKANGNALRKRTDLLWLLLLQSAATHGNSRGWTGLCEHPHAMASIAYSKLVSLHGNTRTSRLSSALQLGKVRMARIKAGRLSRNVAKIDSEYGGLKKATKHMLSIKSREEKLRFVKCFEGIGEKYGRNIWMDIYDPSFRDCIAVDDRIMKIACGLELDVDNFKYKDYERFFVSLAKDAGIEPWELDRLLYSYNEHFLYVIQGSLAAPISVA